MSTVPTSTPEANTSTQRFHLGVSNGSGVFAILKLNQNNFQMWDARLRVSLQVQDCLDVIGQDIPEGQSAHSEYKIKEAKALMLLYSCIEDHETPLVTKYKTAKGLYGALRKKYCTKSNKNIIFLKERFYSIRMKEGTNINEHLDEMF